MSEGRQILFSPAKINLFFRVLGKRLDGYHEISSVIQAISLGDRIEIKRSLTDQFSCTLATLPLDRSNLVLRALTLFRKESGINFPVSIHLNKKIPIQAGLGGGSSNAATTLWGLNQLAGQVASLEELKQWASKISSDAPFFFSLGAAYVEGRGERIKNLDPLPSKRLILAKPSWGMATEEVYRRCLLKTCSKVDQATLLRRALCGDPLSVNDLESAAFALRPELKKIKEKLLSLGFQSVLMTGSGSSFYCIGEVKSYSLEGVTFFRAAFTTRKIGEWYTFLP